MKTGILRFFPAIGWFLLSFFLLTLPGKELPTINWFDKLHGDKFVHIGMFSILVALWVWPLISEKHSGIKKAVVIGGVALAYGIVMEFVQKYLVANRSFDIGDIIADGVGSYIPAVWLLWKNKKELA